MFGIRKSGSKNNKDRRFVPTELEKRIGYAFKNKQLLITALTHPTYTNNVDHNAGDNNQRLEFLGDAVLGLLVAERLYDTHPDCDEGSLTVLRSEVVSGEALAVLGREICLEDFLFMDKGSGCEKQRRASHTIACAVEAVMGAVWLDGGIKGAQKVFDKLFASRTDSCEQTSRSGNPKGDIQAFAHKHLDFGEPVYTLISAEGPEHSPVYHVKVSLGGLEAEGMGSKRKSAEAAAAAAWLAAHTAQV